MRKKPINQVIAEALAFYMGERWNQTTLAKEAGVAPNTIGNAMNPGRRAESASGKEPSIKATELDRIAKALEVPVADLVSDLTEQERDQRQRDRAADYYREHGVLPAWAPPPGGWPRKPNKTSA
jgi:DNA-binding Xre family transcriptional regulator